MSENDPMAGTTTDPVAGGNTDTPSETPSESEADRLARLESELAKLKTEREQHLAEKTERERERRELEELRAQNGNRPTQPAYDPNAAQMQQMRTTMLRVAEQANDPNDPYAPQAQATLYALQALQEQQQLLAHKEAREQRERHEAQSLLKVPAENRDATMEFFNKNRDRFADPEVAHWAMLGQQGPGKTKAQTDADEAARRREAAPAMPSGMSTPGAQPSGLMRMKRAQYYAEVERNPSLVDMKDSGRLILTD